MSEIERLMKFLSNYGLKPLKEATKSVGIKPSQTYDIVPIDAIFAGEEPMIGHTTFDVVNWEANIMKMPKSLRHFEYGEN